MELISIGYLQKPHGTKGEIKVTIEDTYWEDCLAASVFFVEVEGQALPYFKTRIHTKNPITIQFEDINSREAAKVIASKELFLRAEDVHAALNETLAYTSYEGFLLLDKELGKIGVISEVLELPQQQMAVVAYAGKEVMIPLNDTFIRDIDKKQKHLHMELPAGLLDL